MRESKHGSMFGFAAKAPLGSEQSQQTNHRLKKSTKPSASSVRASIIKASLFYVRRQADMRIYPDE